MSENGIEVRLSVLEEWRRSHEELVLETRSDLRAIKTMLAELTLKVAAQRLCPAPGECLKLAQTLEQIEEELVEQERRLRLIEEQRNYWRGMLVVIGAIAGTVTGLLSAILVAAFKQH